MRMDIWKSRYKNFDEVYLYCYYVAGTVGLMSVPIMGIAPESQATTESVYNAALALGLANQLTNILRDVGEDARRGRVYLPQDELAQAGLSDEYIFAEIVTDKWRHFMKEQIQIARKFFDDAESGVTELSLNAILIYLASTFPEVADHWYPADVHKRAKIHSVLDWHHSNLRRGSGMVRSYGGQFLSYLINLAFTKAPGTWLWMLGVAGIPALVQFVLMLYLPESPRWLYRKARAILAILEKIYPADEVEDELKALKSSIEAEKADQDSLRDCLFLKLKNIWGNNDAYIMRNFPAAYEPSSDDESFLATLDYVEEEDRASHN
ncbi:hypothetical protein CASFOL_031000 [Castilleja foliolosa]|uniref:15-cis-phytoene synthase n=1 Tax=Castilleja foliolosa TaxID=1961234 RepID=A0ABD3C880_9LAMI